MASGPESAGGASRWASRGAIDAVVGTVAFAVGAIVVFDSMSMGAGWANGSPQPGYFPLRIGAIICLAATSIVVRAVLRARRGDGIFVRWSQLRRVLAVFGPMLAYILAIAWLGIYVASALFVAGFMRVAGRYGWAKSLVVGAAAGAVLFWLFEIQFLVPLPKGPLEGWLGY
ncbi:MAG TPA: tripartite tricarboxylate transporter TctB family protein [Usitatibacter sp.]|nr:tripartite tricarboxylate transporter TctB family protein [Usitatibacter sp.]